jgi:hypothetical protein
MAKFSKTILRVGNYQSLDGTVKVTPARLRHWVTQFQEFKRQGNVVPVAFDHANDHAGLTPLSVNEFRSAANTVGRLDDLRISRDGQSAEMTLDIADPKAVQLASSNHVFVSPVLCQRWRDGKGNQYKDLWSHVDIVNHPVDQTQSPFTALSNSPQTKFWRFALDDIEDDDKKPMAGSDVADMDDEAVESTDMDSAPMGDDDMAAEMTDLPADPMAEEADMGGDVSELLADLLQVGIVLGDDTTDANFMDRLKPALKTFVAAQGHNDAGNDDDVYKDDEPVQVEQQQFQQMSLSQKRVHEFAQNSHREKVRSRLNRLFTQGKCTPAELAEKRAECEVIRLSLGAQGTPVPSSVEQWIASREPVPKGTFWSKEVKTQRLSVQVEKRPKPQQSQQPQMDDKKAAKIAERILSK